MRYIITFIFAFCCLSVFSQSNGAYMTSPDGGMEAYKTMKKKAYDTAKIDVFYKLRYLRDSTKTDKYTEGMTLLMVSDKYLRFGDYNRLVADSLNNWLAQSKENAHNAETQDAHMVAISKSVFDFSLVTDLAATKTTIQCRKLRAYEYTYPTPVIKWQLEKGDTLIGDVPCKKARCTFSGRNYIAWYAESISMPYGPYVFGGLPGLILELHDENMNWIFTYCGMEEAKSYKEMYLYADKKYIKTNREKALTAYRNEDEDFVNMAVEMGILGEVTRPDGTTYKLSAPRHPSNMLELVF